LFLASRPPPTATLFPYTTLFRSQHPFRCSGIGRRIFFTNFEVFLDTEFFLLGRLVTALIVTKNAHELEPLSLTLRRYTVVTPIQDRKSTRLNSSHVKISYAVFCL